MPTVLRSGPYAFHFYAGSRNDWPPMHVRGDGNEAISIEGLLIGNPSGETARSFERWKAWERAQSTRKEKVEVSRD